MLNNKLIPILIITLLSTASLAFAQQQEIREYKVQKGDTLWDISKKELNDPFLWPKIWKENPDIAKPDRLIPGQVIRIPLYLIQKETKAEEPITEPVIVKEPAKEEPVQKAEPEPEKIKPIVDANLYTASGHVSGSVSAVGKVTGTPSGKTLIGTLDPFYIKTRNSVNIGDRFYITRIGKTLNHPVTKEPVGRLVEIIGIAEVKRFENGETVAQVMKMYNEITIGNLLDTYVEMNPPVVRKPYRKPAVQGFIIAARQLRLNNGIFDIVYIDKGSKHGIEPGDLFKTIAAGRHKVPNGIVQIISVQDSTSTAIVRESKDFLTRGNLVTKAE